MSLRKINKDLFSVMTALILVLKILAPIMG